MGVIYGWCCVNLLKEFLTISKRCDIDSFGFGCPWWCMDCGNQVYLGKYHDGNNCICGSFCCTLCIFYYVFLIMFCCGYELGKIVGEILRDD